MSSEFSNSLGRATVSIVIALSFICACADSKKDDVAECIRGVVYEESQYCMVSFYALISHPAQYDGRNIRLVGYIVSESDAAAIGPNLDSVEGPLISENIVRLQFNDSLARAYESQSGKLSTVFGTFHTSEELGYFGLLDPVVVVEIK